MIQVCRRDGGSAHVENRAEEEGDLRLVEALHGRVLIEGLGFEFKVKG